MPVYNIDSPVSVFRHKEYGTRLLFKNAPVNPRDSLGKNGVTVHGWFAALFYKTIPLQTISHGVTQTFQVNRNSLVKYLGRAANAKQTDEQLIQTLNTQFWKDDASEATRHAQGEAGEHGLRHAGSHHHRKLAMGFIDTLNASFLGWLYQKTISSINRIKARFLFVGSEKNLLDTGEKLAIHRYHDALNTVPAYTTHITVNGVPAPNATFSAVPITSKTNYIKPQTYDSDTHRFGTYPANNKTDTSTGTTGKPTEWVRGEPELKAVKNSLNLAADVQFGERRLSYINAFALGPWATGLTTYELMRETGSVFATGPDKDKILDKLMSIARYERHRLELAITALKNQYPNINPADEILLADLIQTTLRKILKDKSPLQKTLSQTFQAGGVRAKTLIQLYPSKILAIASKLNQEKEQIILAGYPPFLKDITAAAEVRGLHFADFGVVGIVGGQATSEAMRDKLIKDGFNQIYSSYGASDLDINLGVETEYEITIRKAIEQNPALGRELYGENKSLPMVFHYDPMNYHVESDETDELIFTCTRNDRSSPRVRYDLGDKGRVYASSEVEALLSKYGIFQKPKTNLPLMFVWGRDSTVVYNGANLAFTELERAVTQHDDLDNIVLKKAFYKTDEEHFEIWLELKEGQALPTSDKMSTHAEQVYHELVQLNQDFRYQVEKLDEGTPLPTLRFFTRGNSPISDAGGVRKQVLIFEKGVNLAADYRIPDTNCCVEVTLKKSAALMTNPAAASMSM